MKSFNSYASSKSECLQCCWRSLPLPVHVAWCLGLYHCKWFYVRQCKSVSFRNYCFSLSMTMLTLSSMLFIQEYSHLSILSSEGWPVRHTMLLFQQNLKNDSVIAWNLMSAIKYVNGYFACLSGCFYQSCTVQYHPKMYLIFVLP